MQFQPHYTKILCCLCGIQIDPNPANMCANCLREKYDIAEGIPKQLTMHFCRLCGRYLQPPNNWVYCELESKELLSLCLKKVRGLNKVTMVDAAFQWTEPHSRRLRLVITVQKEVWTGVILQQKFMVEYVVLCQQCPQCAQLNATDLIWTAVCQVRQKVEHKRTFYFLEQLLIKHSIHKIVSNVKEYPDGLDFYFSSKSNALKFIEFLQSYIPIRFKASDKLVSHDSKSNVYNYKYSFSVEIAPICRNDLVFLPKKLAAHYGNISQLVLCEKVSSLLHFVDPYTLQKAVVPATMYWKFEFRSLLTDSATVKFVVLENVPVAQSGKQVLSEVQVARESDFSQYSGKTHLGNILHDSDVALGYDLTNSNVNHEEFENSKMYKRNELPDFILVKKFYERRKKRQWKLKHLEKEDLHLKDDSKQQEQYEQFLQELEEDPELRSNVNLYKKNQEPAQPEEEEDEEEMKDEEEQEEGDKEEFPEIDLAELLDELTLSDKVPLEQREVAVNPAFADRHTTD